MKSRTFVRQWAENVTMISHQNMAVLNFQSNIKITTCHPHWCLKIDGIDSSKSKQWHKSEISNVVKIEFVTVSRCVENTLRLQLKKKKPKFEFSTSILQQVWMFKSITLSVLFKDLYTNSSDECLIVKSEQQFDTIIGEHNQ